MVYPVQSQRPVAPPSLAIPLHLVEKEKWPWLFCIVFILGAAALSWALIAVSVYISTP